MTDEALWASVCTDDEQAFAAIFRRHCDAVHTQCARRAGTYAAADDLVATVFLEAWRSRDRARFVGASLRPWLLVIAAHVAAKHLRSSGRYSAMVLRLRADVTFDGVDIDSRLDVEALAPLLASAVSTLRPEEQNLVALCDLAEYGCAEAAMALGIPVGTAKSRLSRAHRKLRLRLGRDFADLVGIGEVETIEMEVRP